MTSSQSILDEIRMTLQGPVMRILRSLVPELAEIESERTYDAVLDDVRMLERCLQAFRDHRGRFAPLLMDAQRRPVGADDELPLACGRSVNEVVGIVVRSAARRYFRRKLPAMVANVKRAAVMERRRVVSDLVDTFRGPRQPQVTPRAVCQGDVLYRAIADYLEFDWQVPLIPSYSRISVAQVRRLGDGLLEARDERMLTAALTGRPMPEPEATPVPTSGAPHAPTAPPAAAVLDPMSMSEQEWILARLIDPQGQVRLNLLADALGGPHARAAVAASTLRQNAIIPPDVGAGAVAALVKLLDFREDQVAIVVVSAYAMLGRDAFPAVFGANAKPTTMSQLIERARGCGIGRYSQPIAIADFIEKLFAKTRTKLLRAA